MARHAHRMSIVAASAVLSAVLFGAASAGAQTFTFQQGVDGYSGASDTMIHGAYADTDYSGSSLITVDAEDAGSSSQALIRFDGIVGDGAGQIPAGTTIESATLRLYSNDDGNGGQLHPMLINWSDAATWSTFGSGVQADDNEALSSADDGIAANSPGVYANLDVTGTVQSWLNGTAVNNGWVVLPGGGTNGWDIASSEHSTAAQRPELVITLPAPPAAPPAEVTLYGPTVSTSPTLEVQVSDPDGQNVDVTFYGRRRVGSGEAFTIVALPDTQYYSQGYPNVFQAQTQWIVDNADSENIVFVTHEGDLVQNADSAPSEWNSAKAAMQLLDGQVPYGMCLGNHDFDYGTDTAALFNQYFPYTLYENEAWYGGHYPESVNSNNYQLFSAGGVDFVAVHLEFWPDADDVAWASDVFASHPDRLGILTTHGFLDATGNRNVHVMGSTQYIWDGIVVPNDNVYLVLCGHVHAEYARADEVNGRTVYQLLADYQSEPSGGNGWLRLMRFVPAENRVYVQTYSPYLNQYQTDSSSEFTMEIPLSWYEQIDQKVGVPSGSKASTVWSGLLPETTYEWFVWIMDPDGHLSESPTWQFTTEPEGMADAADDAYATDEDTPLVEPAPGVLGNDVDGTGAGLHTATVVTDPANGTLLLNADGSFEYTPGPDFSGTDSFTYSASDDGGATDEATVTITVHPVADAPVVEDLEATTTEDTPLAMTLSGSDADGDPLRYTVVSLPAHGSLDISGLPDVIYTPAAEFSGSDSFTFTATDETFDSNLGTVSIVVDAVNDAPTVDPKAAETTEETAVEITLSGFDPEGDALTFSIVQAPVHGTLNTDNLPVVGYTPEVDYAGSDSFTYIASDGDLASEEQTVSITVTNVNDAPVAADASVTTDEDTPAAVVLSASDADADTLTYTILTQPGNGTLSGAAPDLTYTPNADFAGTDSFTFKAADAATESGVATVSITVTAVNDAPDAQADTAATDEDVSVTLAPLANDSDVEGDALSIVSFTQGAKGTVTANGDGTLTYTPNPDANGADSFEYTVSDDNGGEGTATVSVTIQPVNDAPTAQDVTGVSAQEMIETTITLAGADVDGDPLTYAIVSGPTYGTAVLVGNGPDVIYTSQAGYFGSDSFTYTVSDGSAVSAEATVSITVAEVNDPPVAENGSLTTDEDVPAALALTATDPEGDTLTYAVVDGPTHGVLSGDAPNLTYTPEADWSGSDSFTFKVNDGEFDSSIGTISIIVDAVNDAPTAGAQAVTVAEDGSKAIVLEGDDVDGDSLAYTVASGPAHGSLTGTPPNVTYAPEADYNGSDSFTFTVSDGVAGSAPAAVTITVTAVNDAPTASGQTLGTQEDVALDITLFGSDVDGDALTYQVMNAPQFGSLSGTAPDLVYTPHPDWFGTDSFTFAVEDDSVQSSPAEVTITVAAVNDAPVTLDDSAETEPGVAISIDVLANDSDLESAVEVTAVGAPVNGAASLNLDGTILYTPNNGFSGTDSFGYTIMDLGGATASAMVYVTVSNPQPEILFFDGFESGSFATEGWTTTAQASVETSAAYEGVYGALLKKTTTITQYLDTSAYTEVNLSYLHRTEGLQGESLTVEWYDGSAWRLVESTADATWGSTSHFPAGTLQGFRFTVNGNAGNDLAMIDSVMVTGRP